MFTTFIVPLFIFTPMFEIALGVTRAADLGLAPNRLIGNYTRINRGLVLELFFIYLGI